MEVTKGERKLPWLHRLRRFFNVERKLSRKPRAPPPLPPRVSNPVQDCQLVTSTPLPDTPQNTGIFDLSTLVETLNEEYEEDSGNSNPDIPLGANVTIGSTSQDTLDWEDDYSTVSDTDDSRGDYSTECESTDNSTILGYETDSVRSLDVMEISPIQSVATSDLSYHSLQRLANTNTIADYPQAASFSSVMLDDPYPLLGELVAPFLTPTEVGQLVFLCVDAAQALADCALRLDQLKHNRLFTIEDFLDWFPSKVKIARTETVPSHYVRRRIYWAIKGIRLQRSESEEFETLDSFLNHGILKMESLNVLSLYMGSMHANLDALARCTNLVTLELQCSNVDIDPIGALSKLRNLTITDSVELVDIKAIAKLKRLDSLVLERLYHLEDLSPLNSGLAIGRIVIDHCWAVTDTSVFGRSSTLSFKELVIRECEGISAVHPPPGSVTSIRLEQCANLQYFEVDPRDTSIMDPAANPGRLQVTVKQCSHLANCGELFSWKHLETVSLQRCTDVVSFAHIGVCSSSFRNLEMVECFGLSELVGIESLTPLASLTHRSGYLRDVSMVGVASDNLVALDLSYNKRLEDISPLAHCTALQHLELNYCRLLKDIQSLGVLSNLCHLSLIASQNVTDLSSIAGCTSLDTLNVQFLDGVTTANGLGSCTKLRILNMGFCKNLEDIQDLKSCENLKHLNLSGTHISDLTPLSTLPCLEYLNISWTDYITSLLPVLDMKGLRKLDLHSLSRVFDMLGEVEPHLKNVEVVLFNE